MIPNYWKALIKRGDITETDYFEKVAPCNILIKRAKERLIEKFLKGLYKYKEQIGFQKHITLNLLIEEWEAKKNE